MQGVISQKIILFINDYNDTQIRENSGGWDRQHARQNEKKANSVGNLRERIV
jgi:hypothetical protein